MSNSIGNLKNSGLQGNNFPYQLKSLQGLQCICDALGSGGDLATLLQSKKVLANILRDSGVGVLDSVKSFSIANVGAGNGTVKGQTLKPGEIINFDAGVLNNYFETVAYDATGTEFLITYVI